MPQTAQQFWDSVAPITKYLVLGSVLTTVLTGFGLVPYYYLHLDFNSIFSRDLQVWRLFTNLFFFGGFSLNLLFNLLFLIQFSSKLENGHFEGRTADFAFMFLVGFFPMTFAAWLLGVPYLSFSYLTYLVYIWCNKNPEENLSMMFIPVTIPARYFPWALMGLHVLMGGSPIGDLIGIVSGHIYHYLDDYYPRYYGTRVLKTPQFLYSIFPPTRMNGAVHGFGGPQQRNPQPQQPAGRNWGAGRRLAD
ncbi:derlin-2/3 [Acrasis kona]|uniref:Derlin n=1 Tax=Acrasis kona TaxID=1008807 RepID=A0AAW2Z0I9_9EUKA